MMTGVMHLYERELLELELEERERELGSEWTTIGTNDEGEGPGETIVMLGGDSVRSVTLLRGLLGNGEGVMQD
jgi:hypothetical protein